MGSPHAAAIAFSSPLLKPSTYWPTAAIGSFESDTVVLVCRGAIHSATLIPVLQPLDRREDRQRRGVDDHGYCGTAQADSQSGFALSPFSAPMVPGITTAITHLRDVLGDQTYESLARKGETMITAEMATYAYDQIDQDRAELNAVSK